MPIELVLLDFDGTLVDTAPDLIRATNLFLTEVGAAPLPGQQIRDRIGHGILSLMRQILPERFHEPAKSRELETRFLKIYEEECLTSPVLYPGAHEFLKEWTGYVAIVSNKRERFIRPILKKLGIDHHHWCAIVGGDTFPEMKPHPRPFLEVMQKTGTDPAVTAMVGDGAPDVQGALAVGIHSVAVSFGYSSLDELVRLGAESSIDSFDELSEVLLSL